MSLKLNEMSASHAGNWQIQNRTNAQGNGAAAGSSGLALRDDGTQLLSVDSPVRATNRILNPKRAIDFIPAESAASRLQTEICLSPSDPELVRALHAKAFPLSIPDRMLSPIIQKMSPGMAERMNQFVDFAVFAFHNATPSNPPDREVLISLFNAQTSTSTL